MSPPGRGAGGQRGRSRRGWGLPTRKPSKGSFGFGTVSYKLALTLGRDVALCDLDGKPGLDIYVVQGVRPTHQDIVLLNSGTGKAHTKLGTPRAAKDMATSRSASRASIRAISARPSWSSTTSG